MNRRERFDRLKEAAIDASSIIYMLKAGYLGLLGSTITLRSVPEIVAETGWPGLPVTLVSIDRRPGPASPARSASGSPPQGAAVSNDELLLTFAKEAGLPVVSEDRAILRAAEDEGLDYYNSLMMLAFLRYRGRIDQQWYEEAKARLLDVARYGADVLAKFETIAVELGIGK